MIREKREQGSGSLSDLVSCIALFIECGGDRISSKSNGQLNQIPTVFGLPRLQDSMRA
jgi:hypothetical protein